MNQGRKDSGEHKLLEDLREAFRRKKTMGKGASDGERHPVVEELLRLSDQIFYEVLEEECGKN